ncbi:MAG: NeuB family protein, partial [Parcubacteria group bacterium GW2011_GWA2_37_10]
MNKEYNFKIGNREIGPGNPVFIIVEMSANHNQDFERAKEIIKSAAESGADAIKLQTYTPNTLTINCSEESFVVRGSNPDWEGLTLYDLYTKA